jgi:hypothetical protein
MDGQAWACPICKKVVTPPVTALEVKAWPVPEHVMKICEALQQAKVKEHELDALLHKSQNIPCGLCPNVFSSFVLYLLFVQSVFSVFYYSLCISCLHDYFYHLYSYLLLFICILFCYFFCEFVFCFESLKLLCFIIWLEYT